MTSEAREAPQERSSAPPAVLRVDELTKSFRRGPPWRRRTVEVGLTGTSHSPLSGTTIGDREDPG